MLNYNKFKLKINEVFLFLLGMILMGTIFAFIGLLNLFYTNNYYIYDGMVHLTEKSNCVTEIGRYGESHEVGCLDNNNITRPVEEEAKNIIKIYGITGSLGIGLGIGGMFVSMKRKFEIMNKAMRN